ILVGEMRDEETADIAMKAAITGHLVFSTLHTNNSINAITRLINMGVPPHLIASSVTCVLAQRLARILCDHCKAPAEADPAALARLNITERAAREMQFFRPVGCDACNNQGYRGRLAIPEMLLITPGVRELIAKHAPEGEIRRVARDEGLKLMAENGIDRIREGRTTLDEVLRAVVVEVTDYQICDGCGATLHLDFISCPHCAYHVRETCPGCQGAVETDWIVCPRCRLELREQPKRARAA
ncbi:MAG: Flp pilus assembly complex ATPase component TadA, partial [Myxococcales bacterium]|nr:Flp pilus assembly complex ATPase component TadA [Myxococcales bacterium]